MHRARVLSFLTIPTAGLIMLVIGLWIINGVSAQTFGDGRINVIEPLGGVSIYCVTDGQSGGDAQAGIRLLNANGSEILFVPAENIPAPGPQASVLARVNGPHSLLTLYLLSSGEFQLNGLDDNGNPFEFRWSGCTQPGPAVNPLPPNDSSATATLTPTNVQPDHGGGSPTVPATSTPIPANTPVPTAVCDAWALCDYNCRQFNPFPLNPDGYNICFGVCIRNAFTPVGVCASSLP